MLVNLLRRMWNTYAAQLALSQQKEDNWSNKFCYLLESTVEKLGALAIADKCLTRNLRDEMEVASTPSRSRQQGSRTSPLLYLVDLLANRSEGGLTNAVRLYGTDCNQTEMVLHSIKKLELTDMKVWLGVWLGNNDTTNDRQLAQMWKILDENDASAFKGVIIGNEVLFRKDLTETELFKVISDVKSNLTDKKIDLPVATSDLGDNWKADMVTEVDIVMSNVHPFFAGVEVSEAAGWTWTFWTTHDVALTSTDSNVKQIIAEVGWPSGGGNDCGPNDCTTDTEGSIAGIDEMNQFMDDWVCQSLANGTEYFW